MEQFRRRLAALNKKAARFGLLPITILSNVQTVYERRSERVGQDGDRLLSYLVRPPEGTRVRNPVLLNRLYLSYPMVKLGAWSVVGKIESVPGGNLVFCITGEPGDAKAVAAYAAQPVVCEHCSRARRRSGSFILKDENGKGFKAVGTSCLNDFTGIDPAAALFLAKLSWLVRTNDDDLEEFAGSGRDNAVNTLEYLADVAFLSRHGGFVSSAKAKETGLEATYSAAQRIVSLLQEERLAMEYAAERDDHLATAGAVRAWMLGKQPESDFDANAKLLLANEALGLDRKHLAFAAATVAMFSRHTVRAQQAVEPSQHVGEKGQSVETPLFVDRVVEIANPHGRNALFLVLMRDMAGNRLKWKTAAPPREFLDGGRRFQGRFKVKAHGEYRDAKQTDVTHVKVLSWLEGGHPLDVAMGIARERV